MFWRREVENEIDILSYYKLHHFDAQVFYVDSRQYIVVQKLVNKRKCGNC